MRLLSALWRRCRLLQLAAHCVVLHDLRLIDLTFVPYLFGDSLRVEKATGLPPNPGYRAHYAY